MIRSRLSYVRYYLRILTLLLPACAYYIAVKMRFGFNLFFPRSAPSGLPSYWAIMLLTTIVWAITAEDSALWNVEDLYAPGKKSRRLLETLAFTYAIVMALGFMYRGASYSRLVVAVSAAALFVIATITRIVFRVIMELLRRHGRNEVKILMVGTVRFARRVATTLLNGEVLPCRVVGFVRLPDQEITVEGPVYQLDHIRISRMVTQSTTSSSRCLPVASVTYRKSHLRWRSSACQPEWWLIWEKSERSGSVD